MSKYIDADKLTAALEQQNADKSIIEPLIRIIDSLRQGPLIHTELCTLIACDIIQATAKRAIEKPQDKDKEEDLMIKKMEYLNLLEKSFFQQEQPEVDIPSAGSGAMGTTPPKFKLEVKEDAGGFPIVPLDVIELYDYENDKPLAKPGDKVRIIVIKED